jgi:hypothetical protein
MKTTNEVMTEWFDISVEILVSIIFLPFVILMSIPLAPFWVAAKIYTTWFQKESK